MVISSLASHRTGAHAAALTLIMFCCAGSAQAEAKLSWELFSDVNFSLSDDSGSRPSFVVGGVDLFVMAMLSDQFRIISENVLEVVNGEAIFDLERIHLDIDITDWLGVRVGRMHTPMGYYSTAFHHALLLQLAGTRPALLRFEDEGGVFPSHFIGLNLYGHLEVGEVGALDYNVGVGNGRGQSQEEILSSFDRNRWKAIVARVSFDPFRIPGSQIGFSAYWDKIPRGAVSQSAGTATVYKSIDEIILGAHVVYREYPFDVIAEGYWARHSERNSDNTTTLIGGFVQVGYDIDRFTPYGRLEALTRPQQDAFFNPNSGSKKISIVTLGMRYRMHSRVMLKAEYTRDISFETNSMLLQAAFGM